MKICRVCMVFIDLQDSVNIFSEIKDDTIAKILENISGIQIENDELLPACICKICFKKVESFCELKEEIINTNDCLKEVLEKQRTLEEEFLDEVTLKEELEGVAIEYLDVEVFDQDNNNLNNSYLQLENDESKQPNARQLIQYLETTNEKLPEKIHGIITNVQIFLRCCECHQNFPTGNELIAHSQKNHSENYECIRSTPSTEFVCPVCFVSFRTKEYLTRHLHKAQSLSYECEICSVSLKTEILANEHVEELHKEPIFKCCGCNFTTDFKESLQEHGRLQHYRKKSDNPKIPIQCEICYIGLSTVMGYKLHKINAYRPKSSNTRRAVRVNVENILVCCGCKTTFAIGEESALISHRDKQHGPRKTRDENDLRPECDFCFKRFASKSKLSEHFKEIQQKQLRRRTLECGLCKLIFKCEDTLLAHMKEHSDGTFKTFKCCGCKEQYNTREELMEHSQAVHAKKKKIYYDGKDRPFECNICFRSYAKKRVLLGHQRTQYYKEKKQFVCDACGKVFMTISLLRYHSLSHSGGGKPFKCNECKREFVNQALMNLHFKRMHTLLEEKYQCNECGKKFKHPEDFRSHLASHSTERPYSCELCKKTFRRANHLKIHHVRNHSLERNYPCRYCESKFLFSYDRKKHEVRHTGIYPHKCKICNKNFVKRYEMITHYESHIPDSKKIHKCTFCSKKYSVPEHLEGHVKGTHNEHSLQEIARRQKKEQYQEVEEVEYSNEESE